MTIKNMTRLLCIAFVLSVLGAALFGDEIPSKVSEKTIAAVVRLGKIFDIFQVQGMPDNHKVTVEYGIPNFGGGSIIQKMRQFMDYGSGVMVTPDGWLVTNAHVADDWTDYSKIIQDYTDNKGNKSKFVYIPANPGYLWVTVAKEADIKNKLRKLELLYVAQTMYYDTNHTDFDRDRAICKIIAKARMNPDTKLPELVSNDVTGEVFPTSGLGNPFDLPIQDAYVTAMGFPGSGPQTFTTITKGEFMGYERTDRSYLMHSAFISGGNSGGGLFFNDKLIGINTWDKSDPNGRHISIAQPITFWGESFAYINLWYNGTKLPEVDDAWIAADPSTDPYKNKVYVGFTIVSAVNEKVALKNGFLLAFKKDVKKDDAFSYIDFSQFLQNYNTVSYLKTAGYSVENISAYLLMNQKDVLAFVNMTPQELVNSLSDSQKKYLDIIKKGDFYANYWFIDQYGQALAAIPAANDFNVTVVSNGYKETDYKFTSNKKITQGPFLLKVSPQ